MMKILANDGIHPTGQKMLEEAGFQVDLERIPQDELADKLNDYDAIIVRSATKVRQELIDQCPNLKVIARGGVGMDNIDVEYARNKGLTVVNTPAASSRSVAELVFGHVLSLVRSVHLSNREMPRSGSTEFKKLKKAYSGGIELRGKTFGVVGLGRIGREAAQIALGMGMKVVGTDPMVEEVTLEVALHPSYDQKLSVTIPTVSLEELLREADVITLHVPGGKQAVLGESELAKAKKGVILVNAARGGVIDEDALLDALESGQVGGAGLDVFVNEPSPRADLLNHPRVSDTPHIGASTGQAQENIGIELANQIIAALK